MRKILRNIFGIIFLLIGFIGGFIPVFQGWIFVLVGFILIDFKNKEKIENKILSILEKNKLGKKLSNFWLKVKLYNRNLIDNKNKDSIFYIYKNINKNIIEK